jgi:thymidylate synthase ThyX
MPICAKVIEDSLGPSGCRLTTIEATYPRFIHSELMTHRLLSRNAASSRAIPVTKLIESVENHPALPVWWGKNQSGMQAHEEVENLEEAKTWWIDAARSAVAQARRGVALGLHKQIVNRVLEPFMHITTIISATEWDNFFFLRMDVDAQPEFRVLATTMHAVRSTSSPKVLREGEWHMPYLTGEDRVEVQARTQGLGSLAEDVLRKVSVGRCARVSYLTHDGKRSLDKDVELYDRLLAGAEAGRPMHISPLEHVAMALKTDARCGNFYGFRQLRKTVIGEHRGRVLEP